MEDKMKYLISIIILSLVLFSCSKKDDDSSTTTTELEGTWVESCHADAPYYRINTLTVSGTNWVDTLELHSDSSCATDVGKYTYSYESLSIGDAVEVSGVSGHKFTMTLSDGTYTSQSSDDVNWCNTNSYCGLTGWELNTPQSIAGKTHGSTTFWSKGTSAYGTYTLDGSELFFCVSIDDYPSSSCLPTTGWNKQ
jgi:hypothetical protein